MTLIQKRKILQRISETEAEIAELKQTRAEIARNGFASATATASGGGSKSYTRLDISKITEAISALTTELKQLRAMLGNGATPLWKTTLVVYS